MTKIGLDIRAFVFLFPAQKSDFCPLRNTRKGAGDAFNLLLSMYLAIFLLGVNLTTQLQLMPRLGTFLGYPHSRYIYSLRIGRSGDRVPVEARFSLPSHTGPGAHPASCTMGTRSLCLGLSGRGVALTTHPQVAPRLKKE